ncbi:TolC family protein [Thiosulfativibrio zosterae]|uniref:Outer membrane protein TolC n=1 Tax=Thiosulfativibrio zosterae TaxID=2675053 RepID=A0A6F8PQI1_9GAMM|nr:TolC family protein [Thiosulfativibrio zosterae]BBP44287.1 outer membrane protein TolC [Thiosulfativibrio zosterae]
MKKNFLIFMVLKLLTPAFAEAIEPKLNLSIDKAFEMTLENNDLLSSRKAQMVADQESLNQAWAGVYPSVSISGVYGAGEYSTTYTPNTSDTFNRYGVQIVQPIFSDRKFEYISRQSTFADYSKINYQFETQKTLLDMTYAFLDLAKSQRLVETYRAELEDHKVKFVGLEAMLERGLATKMDVLEAQAKQDDILASLKGAESTELQNRKKLERLLGGKTIQSVIIDETLWQRARKWVEFSNWSDLAKDASLNLRIARYNVQLAKQDSNLEKSSYYPEVNLRAAIDNTDSYESTFRDNKKIQLEMTWPLYEGGSTNSKVRASNQKILSQQLALQDAEKMLNVQINEVVTGLMSSVANIDALDKSVTSNKLYLDSAEKGLSYGLRGVFDILDAKTRIYDTERRMVNEIYGNLRGQFELLFLLGKLDEEHLSQYLQKDFTPDLLNP